MPPPGCDEPKKPGLDRVKNHEARSKFTGSYKENRVVHGQINLCSSRIVETLATYRKLDTTICNTPTAFGFKNYISIFLCGYCRCHI